MRRVLVTAAVAAVLAGGGGVAVAGAEPSLVADGPTAVTGTDASAVFELAGRTVRQVRYLDGETLVYSFSLENPGRLPLRVTGLAPSARPPRLFDYVAVTDTDGHESFTIPAGGERTVEVHMVMHACETLSARAGSFATEVALRTERAGVLDDVVTVAFPEEVHTGSPREASCPRATASSRPPG